MKTLHTLTDAELDSLRIALQQAKEVFKKLTHPCDDVNKVTAEGLQAIHSAELITGGINVR